jgi:hypothetical protein
MRRLNIKPVATGKAEPSRFGPELQVDGLGREPGSEG